ncbi:MAG: hypothetical protein V3V35_08355 [Dehalococcoidia bacterium]
MARGRSVPTIEELRTLFGPVLSRMVEEERGFICRALEEGVVLYERLIGRGQPLA